MNTQDTYSGKMSLEHTVATEDKILGQSSKKSFRAKFQRLNLEDGRPQEWSEGQGIVLRGEHSMRNTSESPRDARESFLWQILEVNPHPKYSLSAKATQGILRRAEARGKKLPPVLEMALRSQVGVQKCGAVEEG